MPRIAALVVIAALALAGARPLHCAMPGAGSEAVRAAGDAEHGHAHLRTDSDTHAGTHADPHGSGHDGVGHHGRDHGGDAPAGAGSGLPCSALAPCSATALPTLAPDPDVQRLPTRPVVASRYAPPAVHDLATEPPPPRFSRVRSWPWASAPEALT